VRRAPSTSKQLMRLYPPHRSFSYTCTFTCSDKYDGRTHGSTSSSAQDEARMRVGESLMSTQASRMSAGGETYSTQGSATEQCARMTSSWHTVQVHVLADVAQQAHTHPFHTRPIEADGRMGPCAGRRAGPYGAQGPRVSESRTSAGGA
jgi:hypothetical protein